MKKNIKIISFVTLLLFLLSVGLSELPNQAQNIDAFEDDTNLNTNDGVTALIFGIRGGPSNIDPQVTWDSESFAVIDQVVEGLFAYNLSDPKMGIIPNLALDYGTWSGSNYTVDLKPNIYFHDGTLFDAYAVKFTFDRLNYFMENDLVPAGDLYKYYDVHTSEVRNIINDIDVIDENTITFVLGQTFATFEALLCFEGSYIVSPFSTPATEMIDISTDTLIGTGPFVFDNYETDIEVNFHAFENYWKGAPNITNLKFAIIYDNQARNSALLSGDVDIIIDPLDSMLDIYRIDPNITLESTQGFSINYIAMNDKWINTTFRKAISYTINYSYIIDVLMDSEVVRMKSPFPENMIFANWSYDVADFNITKAREIMQSMGFGVGFTTNAQWQSATFASFKFSYNIGNSFKEDLMVLLWSCLDLIGIDVIDDGMTWGDFLFSLFEDQDSLQLYWLGWGSDYNDPHPILNMFFTNRSSNEFTIPFKDFIVQTWVEEALYETNDTLRNNLYNKIQQRLVEELYPWAFGYVPLEYVAYNQEISGFQWNSMQKVSFYEVNGIFRDIPTPPPTDTQIYIDGDSTGIGAQNWTWAVNQNWCSGAGTIEDPYIIEDLIIDGPIFGIVIKNSEVSFEVVNCTIMNTGSDFEGAAIQLTNVTNGNLIGNNCSNNKYYGISLVDCYNCTIFNNFLTNNIYGITARLCQNLNITNNYMENVSAGIGYDDKCFNSIIDNNTIIGATIGISPGGQNHVLRNNNLESCGIIFFYFFGNINDLTTYDVDTSNTINEKPIYYYVNRNNLVPNDFLNAGQVILINCNNSLISNLDISDSSAGILLYGCNYNNFSNVNTLNEAYGLLMYQSSNNHIENSVFSESIYYGIYMYGGSVLNTIEKSIISENVHGMYVGDGNNTVNTNFILNNTQIGISTGYETRGSLIYNNTFIGNEINAAEGGTNHWDNGIIGNYWDDYSGVDANDDGIGDSPYIINGGAGSMDNYPIWDDGPDLPIPQYWVLSPFIIDELGYGDYTWEEVAMEDWCSGSGTWSAPYIIENIVINGQNSSSCIEIKNSNVYFIIKNCRVYNAKKDSSIYLFDAGITLGNVDNGAIFENNCSNNNGIGISLYNCNNVTLSMNIILNNGDDGINMDHCSGNILYNNTISNNNDDGIMLYQSQNNVLSSNTILNNNWGPIIMPRRDGGIILMYSNHNTVSMNYVSNNNYAGVYIYHSNNINISKNTISYNGAMGILLATNELNTVSANTISHNFQGIQLWESNQSTISDNIISDQTNKGILIDHSSYNDLSKNSLLNNGDYGITIYDCYNLNISRNILSNQDRFGITVASSHANIISKNSFLNNGEYAIHFSWSNNNTYSMNTVSENSNGIYIGSGENNAILSNTISYNIGMGILMQSSNCRFNSIYNNSMITNGENALDNGVSNYWDKKSLGNFWDDYMGEDANDDGIGDTPYTILGTAGAVDNYPIWDDGPSVDDVAPSIVINYYDEYALFGTGAIFIEAYITDNVQLELPVIIEFYYPNGTLINVYDMILNISDSSDTYFFYWTVDSLPVLDGYYFIINAYDSSNNLAQANEFFDIVLETPIPQYWILSPFSIDELGYGHGNYTWAQVVNEEWCSGSGTLNDPYVIKNLVINGQGSDFCLSIQFSEEYFIVENCTFYNTYNLNYYGGLVLINSSNGKLLNNNCSDNYFAGIYLWNSHNFLISGNFISTSSSYGIIIDYLSSNNIVYNNTLIENNINAFDNGGINFWDNGVIGNYWDDYSGVDANDDGIGDTPYNIGGMAGSMDNFPIWDDGPEVPSSDYWILSPFVIDDDGYGNYTWEEASNQEWCRGFGTFGDPYVIKNLIIDCNGLASGITIENSSVYFRIENCTVYNGKEGSVFNYEAAIKLLNTTNGLIINNTCSFNQGDGILLSYCSNITIYQNRVINNGDTGIYIARCEEISILNNTIFSNIIGIWVFELQGPPLVEYGISVNISIMENDVHNNTNYGIVLLNTINSHVSKNEVSESNYGIMLINSNNSIVTNNRIEDCISGGIDVRSNNYSNLTENVMFSCGLTIYGSYSELLTYSMDTSNFVNGKPFYYYTDRNDLDNSDFINPGQIILVNCSNSILSNINISYSSAGLTLIYCTNMNITDCNFSDNNDGIILQFSDDNSIYRNLLDNNYHSGITLTESNNNLIYWNTLSNNNADLTPNVYYSGGPPTTNARYGVGILLWDENSNNIIFNNILTTNNVGIYLYNSSYSTISNNSIEDNYEYGIYLERDLFDISESNLIYSNHFESNLIENAYDNGVNTYWDNDSIGNYWNNYLGVDANDDGIGDTPYSINGSAGSLDNFPIWDDGPESPIPQYWVLSPFIIDEDGLGDYTWSEVSNQPWCSGFGTESNPYLIENIAINGQDFEYCLWIRNSDAYFILKNCTFYNSYTGLKLENLLYGFIEDGNFSNNYLSGISSTNCINITISNNILNENGFSGLNIYNTNNSFFTDNSIDRNFQLGISVDGNDNNFLRNILRYNGLFGIYALGKSNQFSENLMYGTGFILLPDSFAFYSIENIPSNNLLDGKPVYFYKDMVGLGSEDFINAAQILLYNCNDSLITNLSLVNGSVGVYMVKCYNNLIQDNFISKSMAAIYLVQSNYITINHNNITDNLQMGIYIDRSNFTSIIDNNIEKNLYNGITLYGSSDGVISENTIAFNMIGIDLQLSTNFSIYLNIFIQNSDHALDYGTNNNWDNGSIGNYWDDYPGVDVDDNGIGDTPYSISGSAISIDNYPIWDDGPDFPIPQYWILSPFVIDEDGYGDYTWEEVSNQEWCSGSGSFENPYVLKNLIIDCKGLGSGITIENSSVFFRIENCTVYNASEGEAAIKLVNTHNGLMISNTCTFNQGDGMYLSHCSNITIYQNRVINNDVNGIFMERCEEISVFNNTLNSNSVGIYVRGIFIPFFEWELSINISIVENNIHNNERNGIILLKTSNSYVSKNNISKSLVGVLSLLTNNSLVINNHVRDCIYYGIGGSNDINMNFTKNLMISCGISISGSYSTLSTYSIDTSNLVNKKPVYYYLGRNNLDNADFINPGQIILVNCNDSTISNIEISFTSTALNLFYCNNINIIECNFSDNYHGISLQFSDNNYFFRTILDNNYDSGIYLYESNSNFIFQNDISNSNADLTPNQYQITDPPLRTPSGVGVILLRSYNNRIYENTLISNNVGVFIFEGSYNTITDNIIEDNYEYGLFIDTIISELNLIYCNYFISNLIENALDNATNNQWYNGTIGNYWDDYTGADVNDDGIGDTPYNINGSAGSVDNYPIWEDGPDLPIPQYWILSPFIIDDYGYGDYTWLEVVNEEWCRGSGTQADPYIVENIFIDGGGMDYCISIRNSFVYFILKNCTFINANNGVDLNIVVFGTLQDGNYSNNLNSGINLFGCALISIIDNVIQMNSYYGINLYNTNNSVFSDNSISRNFQVGVYSYASNDNIFLDNVLKYNAMFGIFIHGNANQFSRNLMYGTGFMIMPDSLNSYSMVNIPSDNLLDGKPIYFYRDMIGLGSGDFVNASQIILYNCNESLVSGLLLTNATTGIYMVSCNNNLIENNLISDGIYGIALVYCNYIVMNKNNIVIQQYGGIYVDHSNFTSIIDNNIENSTNNGITISGSTNNTIMDNTISYNYNGITIQWNSEYNVIKNNSINNCAEYGISVYDSPNNLIYLNQFEQNFLHAFEYGTIGNYWDNGIIGNYWDDYSGVDYDDDGIGDTPYYIEGDAGSQDNYPIWDDGPETPSPQIWLLSPFVIDDDGYGDYTWLEVVNEEWCRGSGMLVDPYIIENVIIDCNGSETGIYIRNSDVYFILRNCTVYNAGNDYYYYYGDGIRLEFVTNGVLLDNNCSFNSGSGISLTMSSNISIINNSINENGFMGISSSNSNYTQYIGNTLKDNFMVGLYIHGQFNTFSNNLMYGTGFLIFPDSMEYYTTEDVDTTNLFDDKPIYFYSNEVGLSSDDFINAGQILLYNCNDSSISNLDLISAAIGVYMVSCYNNVIQNNLISNGIIGVYLIQSNYIVINSNDITLQLNGGIFMDRCNFTSINNNNFDNNNYNAISIYGSSNGIISENNITNNMQGINLEGCDFTSIINNNIEYNNYTGITSYGGSNGVITENRIANNQLGINLQSSHYLIYFNSFIQNIEQAMDYGTNNNWDNGTIGNYWDNYDGVDYDDDGIGDVPHLIEGYPGGIDNFPIWDDGPGAPDSNPPTTNIILEGILGDNGWYVSEVFITLTATDDISGVSIIEYSNDSINWITYTGPFTILYEGISTIYYRSIDNAGNIENTLIELVKIDKSYGETTIELIGGKTFGSWHDWDTLIVLSATDTYSGISRIEYSFDGIHWTIYETPFNAPTSGIVSIYYRSADFAGNIELQNSITIKVLYPSFIIDNYGGGDYTWYEAVNEGLCTGVGTLNNPYIIENMVIDAQNLGSGIEIRNSNAYFIIRNCTIFNSSMGSYPDWNAGIKLVNTNNGVIINNNCSNNSYAGIKLYMNSNNNLIVGNIANYNSEGIYIQNCGINKVMMNNVSYNFRGIVALYSNNINISGNIAVYNGYGIQLGETINSYVLDNIANHNSEYGIVVGDYSFISGNIANFNYVGIRMYLGEHNTIINNTASYNIYTGILILYHSSDNIITDNIVYNNEQFGINIWISENTLIYKNDVRGSGTSNAVDDGTNNNWDNGIFGNYWDDYSGVDLNDDGFGDIPYNIPGTAGSIDNFPTWDDGQDDFLPPITTISIEGVQGQNGWYTSTVNIILTAIDDASGVAYTNYSYDGDTWFTYTGVIHLTEDGSATLYYRSVDNMGKIEQYSVVSLKIDRTSPTTTINVSGTPGNAEWYTSDISITLSALDITSGLNFSEYSYDGVYWNLYTISINIDEQGITEFYYRSFDIAGNEEEAKIKLIKIDTTAPTTTISLEGIIGNDNWYVSDVQVTLESVDIYSEVFNTYYSLNGLNWNLYTEPFDILTEGLITLHFYSIDNAGISEEILIESFKIDKTPPNTTINLSGTLGSNNWYVSDVLVSLSATDSISGLNYSEYSYDGVNWNLYSTPLSIGDQGITDFYYRSFDLTGNEEFTKVEIIKIDKSTPTTTINLIGTMGQNEWYTSDVYVSLDASDIYSETIFTHYNINGSDWIAYIGPFYIDFEGEFTFAYKSYDEAGNTEIIKSEIVKIDKTFPETEYSVSQNPCIYNWYRTDVLISLLAVDNISNIAYSEYSYDGINWYTYTNPFNIPYNGKITIHYRSIDKAGNLENFSILSINIVYTQLKIDELSPGMLWSDAVSDGWASGSGTWNDPYIIENIVVRSGLGGPRCIQIFNSEAYFIIRNCTFYTHSGHYSASIGIYLNYVKNAKIIDNICFETTRGMRLTYCENNSIIGNEFNYNWNGGLRFDYSNDNTVVNNKAIYNWYDGFYFYSSHNNNVSGNIIEHNRYSAGFILENCDYNNIHDNELSNNKGGILLIECNYNILSRNNVYFNNGNGFYFSQESQGNILTENSFFANGLSGIYLEHCQNFEIKKNAISSNHKAGIYLKNCSDITIEDNMVGYHIFAYTNHGIGIYLEDCTLIKISNNDLKRNDYSIVLEDTNSTVIMLNSINNCDVRSISVQKCHDIIIRDNIINNYDYLPYADPVGLYLVNSSIITILDNTITKNDIGIYVENSKDSNLTNNVISNNRIAIYIDNSWNDILINNYLSYNEYGIEMYHCENIQILNNTITNNDSGVNIEYCQHIIFKGNNVTDNYYGATLQFEWCFDIHIIENIITGNFEATVASEGDYYFIIGNNICNNEYGSLVLHDIFSYSLVSNNTICNNGEGIILEVVNGTEILGNTIENNQIEGIFMHYCHYNIISNNIISNNINSGIYLEWSDNNIITGNYISNNNGDGIYIENGINNTISNNCLSDNFNGIAIYSCGESLITGNFMEEHRKVGIYLHECFDTEVSDNEIRTNDDYGIIIRYCYSKISILNNTIHQFASGGIILSHSNNVLISGNYLNHSWWGTGIVLAESDNNTILSNILIEGEGIDLTGSHYNFISGNIITVPDDHYGFYGFYIERNSSYNIIRENIISSQHTGIWICSDNSRYNIITENLIINNTLGIHVNTPSYNEYYIYNNVFIGNTDFNAIDDGMNIFWDNGTLGNYWDDYTGVDANDDGIGDTPYNIMGLAGSIDNYPIWDDGQDFFLPSDYLEIIIDILITLGVPESSQHLIEQAILSLTQAKEKFESGMIYEAYDKVKDAVGFLMDAEELGAKTQEITDSIVFLTRYIVEFVMERTIDIVGEDNKFILRAIDDYNTALLMIESEEYDEAVKYFKNSLRNIMKARTKLIVESFVSDLYDRLAEIQDLMSYPIPDQALFDLEQAEQMLLLAIDQANKSLLASSFYKLIEVVVNLLDAEDNGLSTSSIIESLMSNIDDVTYLKILEAESLLLGESNRHLDKALVYFDKAQELWDDGNLKSAISYYAKVIGKVKDALT